MTPSVTLFERRKAQLTFEVSLSPGEELPVSNRFRFQIVGAEYLTFIAAIGEVLSILDAKVSEQIEKEVEFYSLDNEQKILTICPRDFNGISEPIINISSDNYSALWADEDNWALVSEAITFLIGYGATQNIQLAGLLNG